MKRFMKWDSRRFGGKKGFTLIELLIVMVILAILAGIVIISIGGVIGRGQETAYNAERESLQTAVLSFYASENSTWPTTTWPDAGIIDMSLLTVAVAPALPYLDESPTSANVDNTCADLVTECLGHYVWMVNAQGNVYSECVGAGECTIACNGAYDPATGEPETAGGDGWQDVYP